jgi:hypothetical protein
MGRRGGVVGGDRLVRDIRWGAEGRGRDSLALTDRGGPCGAGGGGVGSRSHMGGGRMGGG